MESYSIRGLFLLDGMRYVRVVLVVYGPGPARMHEFQIPHPAFHLVLGSRHKLTQMTATDPTDAVDDEDEAMDNYVWSGNRHRKLWKSTCTRAALNVRPPPCCTLEFNPNCARSQTYQTSNEPLCHPPPFTRNIPHHPIRL